MKVKRTPMLNLVFYDMKRIKPKTLPHKLSSRKILNRQRLPLH